MIHFQTNPNLFYFNSTDLTNGCLFIQDQNTETYGILCKKAVMYICQAVHSPDRENQSAYNNIQNSRYLAVQQTEISKDKYEVVLVNQLTQDVKKIFVSYDNKKNVIDLRQLIDSNYIIRDKIYSVLVRDVQLNQYNSNQEIQDYNLDIKSYSFSSDDLINDKLMLTKQQLGLQNQTQIVIQNQFGNLIQDINFVKYNWVDGELILQFNNSGLNFENWKIKYLVDGNINDCVKTQTQRFNIQLDGKSITNDKYTVTYTNTTVDIKHNSNGYINGVLYDSNNKQILMPIDYKNTNQAALDFQNIPGRMDWGQQQGQYLPSESNKYLFIMFVTRYYLSNTVRKTNNNIKSFQFQLSDLDQNKELHCSYSDLGVSSNVNVVIQNQNGNIVNDDNFIKCSWVNNILIVSFVGLKNNSVSINDVGTNWKIKYISDQGIKKNIKSQTKQYNVLLNGNQIVTNDYSVVYNGSIVTVTHNSNNYVMGYLYDKNYKQIYIPINYKNTNQAWMDFQNIPSNLDFGQLDGQYNPTEQNPYTFVMFVTKYYLDEEQNSLQVNTDNNDQIQNVVQDSTVKIYQFKNSDLDSQHKIILTYADLGINTNVNVVIQNSAGNIANNENFVKWSWENSYLTIQFVDFQSNIIGNQNLTDTWRIKYLLNGNIKQNIKSQTKQYTITLNGDNVFQNNYSVIYDGTKVYVNHNSNNYIMGMLYNSNKEQVYIPINYSNMNQAWFDFESIPNTFDDGDEIGQYFPTQQNPYTFVMFVTKYYLEFTKLNDKVEQQQDNKQQNEEVVVKNLFESNQLEVIKNDEQYYPATKIKLNQIKQNDRANFVIDKLLTPSIVQFRQIRIYNERAVRLDDYHYKVTYQNMLNDTIQVFMNGSKIPLDVSEYTVDLQYSIFKFNFATTTRDSFEIIYSFDYFPSHVLYGFLERAVSELNVGPVGTPTSYTFETAPQFYNGLIANYAYVFCLDKLILDYNLWRGRLVFALPPQALADGSGDIISQLQSLRSNAWQRISIALNNAKLKAPQYLAHPTALYYQGISPLGRYSGASGKGFNGGKLRGLKINRYGSSF